VYRLKKIFFGFLNNTNQTFKEVVVKDQRVFAVACMLFLALQASACSDKGTTFQVSQTMTFPVFAEGVTDLTLVADIEGIEGLQRIDLSSVTATVTFPSTVTRFNAPVSGQVWIERGETPISAYEFTSLPIWVNGCRLTWRDKVFSEQRMTFGVNAANGSVCTKDPFAETLQDMTLDCMGRHECTRFDVYLANLGVRLSAPVTVTHPRLFFPNIPTEELIFINGEHVIDDEGNRQVMVNDEGKALVGRTVVVNTPVGVVMLTHEDAKRRGTISGYQFSIKKDGTPISLIEEEEAVKVDEIRSVVATIRFYRDPVQAVSLRCTGLGDLNMNATDNGFTHEIEFTGKFATGKENRYPCRPYNSNTGEWLLFDGEDRNYIFEINGVQVHRLLQDSFDVWFDDYGKPGVVYVKVPLECVGGDNFKDPAYYFYGFSGKYQPTLAERTQNVDGDLLWVPQNTSFKLEEGKHEIGLAHNGGAQKALHYTGSGMVEFTSACTLQVFGDPIDDTRKYNHSLNWFVEITEGNAQGVDDGNQTDVNIGLDLAPPW
jgi:hypothetical protein